LGCEKDGRRRRQQLGIIRRQRWSQDFEAGPEGAGFGDFAWVAVLAQALERDSVTSLA